MSGEVWLGGLREQVDGRLDALLPLATREPERLHAAMRYSCLAPGKRLRPGLCIASALAVGGSVDVALDPACAIEMVHCFSLIHDDLPAIDDDDLRRGLPTCHVEFGEALAILAGDALFSLAFQVLARSPGPPDVVLQAIRELADASGSDGLVGGEVIDVLSEGVPVDGPRVQLIHERKTGALIAASCVIGGLFGGADPEQVEALRTYGFRVGLAFQITDDVLNEISTPEQLGKSAGSDRELDKATYPKVFGLEAAKRAAFDAMDGALEALERLPNPATLSVLARYAIERLS